MKSALKIVPPSAPSSPQIGVYQPSVLLAHETRLIEAILEWATEEHHLNGHLSHRPIKVLSAFGELHLRREESIFDGPEDDSVIRFRNLELE